MCSPWMSGSRRLPDTVPSPLKCLFNQLEITAAVSAEEVLLNPTKLVFHSEPKVKLLYLNKFRYEKVERFGPRVGDTKMKRQQL